MKIQTTAGTYSVYSAEKEISAPGHSPQGSLLVVAHSVLAREALVDGLDVLGQARDGDYIQSRYEDSVIVDRAAFGEWLSLEVIEYVNYPDEQSFIARVQEMKNA